jgi:enamine deaminase RidA (YjgF/YER057c/UK114 family)
MRSNAPAQAGALRTRRPPARVHKHIGASLELTTVESASTRELHLTIRPRPGETATAVARRAATELNAREAVAVRVIAFGLLTARDATLAALRSRLKDDVPVTWVEGASCNGHPLAGLQIHAVAGTEVRRPTAATRVWTSDHAIHCVLSGLTPARTNISRVRQAAQVFRAIQTGLAEAGMEMKHVARTWFFLDDILAWYGAFNRVRNEFFDRQGIRTPTMPASTGVRGRNPVGAALTAAVLAVLPYDPVANGVRTVASPGQCPAPAYGSAFSRAVEIGSSDFRHLLVSGTASIAPDGETCHVGDVEGQIARTMEVVEGILASRGMSLADASRAVAYFKSAEDVAVFSRWLRRRGVKRLPVLNVCCDICRPDLLFELELDAIQARFS